MTYDLWCSMTYFVAVAFFAVGFFTAAFGFAAGFAADFAAGLALANFTPASWARLLKLALRRAAVRFSSIFFLTAVSIAPCAALNVVADGLASNALTADLMSRLVAWLRSLWTSACLARLIADLMIGTVGFLSGNRCLILETRV